MLHQMIKNKLAARGPVCAGVIGAGDFGTVIVTQHRQIPGLEIPIVADVNARAAQTALLETGFGRDSVCYAGSAGQAERLIQDGKHVYTDRPEIMMDIPFIEIICEGTGVPEAGAQHCKMAIERRKHVAVINKEVDSVIGPILKKMAAEQGVVYTPVQGDQHGLLLSLISWAKANGFTIVSAGKARDVEFILEEQARTVSVSWEGITGQEWETAHLSDADMAWFAPIPQGMEAEYIRRRAELLKKLPQTGDFDLCELTIMANHTGLRPANPRTNEGYLRITEVPQVYCEKKHGGIYPQEGMLDAFACLRRREDAGMDGGVYVVVKSGNPFSQGYLSRRGTLLNGDRSCTMLYRPFHLCGMEVADTIFGAVLLCVGCDGEEYLPRYDLVKTAARDIEAGEEFGGDHDEKLAGMIVPATHYAPDAEVPGHLLDGNRALVDIPQGAVITYSQVAEPEESLLWQLRRRQEADFK